MSEPGTGESTELVSGLRDYYGAYHHHKEQMAFGAATLYVAGAATVVFYGVPTAAPAVWTPVALSASALIAFVFVWWQFRMRASAAKIAKSATRFLATQLRSPIDATIGVVEDAGVGAVRVDVAADGVLTSPVVSEVATYAVMLVWTVAAWARV